VSEDAPRPRLAELVAALSLGIDLGFGQPMEHVLRQCIIALRIAERAGLDDEDRAAVYYSALLLNVGCHSDAHEQAKWFGDDIATKASKYEHEPKSVGEILGGVRTIGSGNPPLHRFRIGVDFLVHGLRSMSNMVTAHAALARRLGEELALPPAITEALGTSYEWWDGKGWPGAVSGDAIPIASRISQLAEYVEVAHRTGGIDAAVALAMRRRDKQFDPALVDLLVAHPHEVLDGIDLVGNFDVVIRSEPALTRELDDDGFDHALSAIATFVDLKSPYTLGHSGAVADLVRAAGAVMGLPDDVQRTLYRSGLVHGFGRLGVSSAIWDKPGPLRAGEWERVRFYPYLTERMLRQSTALGPLGRIAIEHRERMDGAGYPRGLSGSAISPLARLLGAASAYQAMLEPRPHRAAFDPEQAAKELRADVERGALDGDAAEAVLDAAGHHVPRRRHDVAGLTSREVEVLGLLARGLSNKQIAERLVMSTKTAGKHVEHIYAKTGCQNRASASLFAVQHGILP